MSDLLQKLIEINNKTLINSSGISQKAKDKIREFDVGQIKKNIEDHLENIIKNDFKINSKNINMFSESKKIELIRAFENEKRKIQGAIQKGILSNLPDIMPYFSQIELALLEQYKIDISCKLLKETSDKMEQEMGDTGNVEPQVVVHTTELDLDNRQMFHQPLPNILFFKARQKINDWTGLPMSLSHLVTEYVPNFLFDPEVFRENLDLLGSLFSRGEFADNYKRLSIILENLRKLHQEDPEEHDKIINSSPGYRSMLDKFPNWSQETFLQLKIQHQNYIIGKAVLEYSNRIAKAPKGSKEASQAHDALSCLLENRTSLLINNIYSVVLTGRYQLPCHYHPGTTKPHYITVFAEYLKQNRSLRELSFNGSEIGRDAACYMLEALQFHPTIEKLDMRGHQMHEMGDSESVCQFIEKNKSVKELFIKNLYFNERIAKSFEDALAGNHTLVRLEVAGEEENYLFEKINELLERNRQMQAVTSERQITSETPNTKQIIEILLPLGYDLELVTDIFTSVEHEIAAPEFPTPKTEVKKPKPTEQDALDDLISAGFTM